jgi:hypothetical protein
MVGNTFTNSCKDWRTGTWENFNKWSVRQFGFEDLESEDEEGPLLPKARDIIFNKNKRGNLVLPPKTDFKTVRLKQRVIRGYIGAVYRM